MFEEVGNEYENPRMFRGINMVMSDIDLAEKFIEEQVVKVGDPHPTEPLIATSCLANLGYVFVTYSSPEKMWKEKLCGLNELRRCSAQPN